MSFITELDLLEKVWIHTKYLFNNNYLVSKQKCTIPTMFKIINIFFDEQTTRCPDGQAKSVKDVTTTVLLSNSTVKGVKL